MIDAPNATKDQVAEQLPPTFLNTLASAIFLGVVVSFWILFYTDWFPVFGGLLALTGLFSWFAFILKILPKDKIETLQIVFYERFFNSSKTNRRIWTLFITFAVLCLLLGSVHIFAVGAGPGYSLSVQSGGVRKYWITPSQPVKSLYFTSLIQRRTIRIKVSGYPSKVIQLFPFQRISLQIPDSFIRPVVLIRPMPDLIDLIEHNPKKVIVSIGTDKGHLTAEPAIINNGSGVWVGCDNDIDIPTHLENSWRDSLSSKDPKYLNDWLNSQYVATLDHPLVEGNYVRVEFKNREDGSLFVKKEFKIQSKYPQVEDLDVQ